MVVAAPDKFRGTATAAAIAAAVRSAAEPLAWECVCRPLADGGEGTLDALADAGGHWRRALVSGPLSDPIEAPWLLIGKTAYIEMARASGLAVVGGPDGNDPLGASTYGTGELILAAMAAGARRVVVTLGGSATTDGGLGALRALEPLGRLKGLEIVVACDVETRFVDAAEVFAPQKGATPAQVELLRRRLERLADLYMDERGVDVRDLPGSGAAGGLAGGLASIGARLESGFALVAEAVQLDDALEHARLVVTGEGYVDEESFHGKVVGGVCERAAREGVPVLIVCGDADPGLTLPDNATLVSLTDRFGRDASVSNPCGLIRAVVSDALSAYTA